MWVDWPLRKLKCSLNYIQKRTSSQNSVVKLYENRPQKCWNSSSRATRTPNFLCLPNQWVTFKEPVDYKNAQMTKFSPISPLPQNKFLEDLRYQKLVIFSPWDNHGVGKEKLPFQKTVSPENLWITFW